MANRQTWVVLLGLALTAIMLVGATDASASIGAIRDCTIQAGGGYQYYFLDGDEGRFRQDRVAPNTRAGVFSNNLDVVGRSDETKFDLALHADYGYNYNLRYNVVREDVYSIRFEGDQYRKYYDGSVWQWGDGNYSAYLPAASVTNQNTDVTEAYDENLAADRAKMALEFGLTLPYATELTLGYDRWSRKGTDIILNNGRILGTGQTTYNMVPTTHQVDGVSNIFSAELEHTFAGKFNTYLKQQWETYHDDQAIDKLYYTNGIVSTHLRYNTAPKFKEGLSEAGFNSFVTDNVYMSVNYVHSYLNNQSTLVYSGGTLSPTVNPDTPIWVSPEVQNYRRADAVNIGFAFTPFATLNAQTSYRFEDARTKAHSSVLTRATGAKTSQQSSLDEQQHAENVTLNYSGIPRTLVSLEGNWEQIEENTHHVYQSATKWGYDNDNIVRSDAYSALLVNRPFAPVKVTFRYQYKNERNDWREILDGDSYQVNGVLTDTTYPGVFQDGDQREHEWTAKVDWSITPLWNIGMMYQLNRSSKHAASQGENDGREQEMERESLNIQGNPLPKFMVTGSAMHEKYEFLTPAEGQNGSVWANGAAPFDYVTEAWIYSLGGSYGVTASSTVDLKLQHTYVSGDVRNTLNELWAGYKYKLNESSSLEARYEYFDYNDKSSNSVDDYDGHGAYIGYNVSF